MTHTTQPAVITPKTGTIETPVKRTQCPFYGFMGLPGFLMDQDGNACALTFEHSPCRMEMANQRPCWDACWSFNTTGNRDKVEKLLDNYNVGPKELQPNNQSGWSGVNARGWFRIITGHDLADSEPVSIT